MPKNIAIVVLGASGDLAKRKLIPALSRLYEKNEIDNCTAIIGSGRSEFDDTSFRNRFDISPEFARLLSYHRGMKGLKEYIEKKGNFSRIIFFMAIPPVAYASTAEELAAEGFGPNSYLIIEKPFGYDYQSAHTLNHRLARHFDETHIFRIDHYLAKEAVQNILVFRFANSLFYPVWNSKYIDSIQIQAFETLGVENRGAYFDNSGIIRDMIQNHLIQLLCLLTMEAPVSLDAEDVRNQKINILKSIEVRDCCRYQYLGYLDEKGVAPDSTTETYAEMKLSINNFRWAGTPIHIRTGKALNRKGTEIGLKFKKVPRLLFNAADILEPNKIVFKIQPSEGIVIDTISKTPGGGIQLSNANLAFCYRNSFKAEIPEAYQRLLLDAIRGDRTLFVGAEETEVSWKKFEPSLGKGKLKYYRKGEVPGPGLTDDWIDFEKYISVCE
ncbi:MAG: glucose-6-phosphate dehydrogenase [Chitinivibrionales bacterium]|nr:glucose-6-phosphate dehydrogenase [Chitinivibrionales bacterium]